MAAAPLPQAPDSDAQKLGCGKPATGHGARDVDTCALTRVDCRWYVRIAAAGSSPRGGERSQPSGRGTGGAVRAPTFSDRTSILLHSNPGGWPWRLGRGQIEGWQPEVTGHRRTQRRLQLHRSPRCESVKQGWIRQRPCPHTHTCNTSARSGRQPTAVAVSSAHPVARFV